MHVFLIMVGFENYNKSLSLRSLLTLYYQNQKCAPITDHIDPEELSLKDRNIYILPLDRV